MITPIVRAQTAPLNTAEAREQDDDAADQVDPPPRGRVELEHVVGGDRVELVLDDAREPASAWKDPIRIIMTPANAVQPTAPLLRS